MSIIAWLVVGLLAGWIANMIMSSGRGGFLADLLLQRYPQLLKARYGFNTDGMDGVAVVEGVAAKRGFRLKGGEYDFEKAAHTFLQDYRSGALGRISLETPQSRAELLATYRSTDNPDALQAEDEEEDDDYDWRDAPDHRGR